MFNESKDLIKTPLYFEDFKIICRNAVSLSLLSESCDDV